MHFAIVEMLDLTRLPTPLEPRWPRGPALGLELIMLYPGLRLEAFRSYCGGQQFEAQWRQCRRCSQIQL